MRPAEGLSGPANQPHSFVGGAKRTQNIVLNVFLTLGDANILVMLVPIHDHRPGFQGQRVVTDALSYCPPPLHKKAATYPLKHL